MQYKIIFFILLFYFLVLLQNSFFAHFSIYGIVPNLVLMLVCLISFSFSQKSTKSYKDNYNKYAVISLIIVAGLISDLFSPLFFGISAFSFLAIYFFIRKCVDILRNVSAEWQIVYFLPIFIISLIFYDFIISLFFYFSGLPGFYLFADARLLLASILYNSVLAIIVFYIFRPITNDFKKI
jgi:cell shape-determining protein MreD